MLGQHPELGDDALARPDVAGGEADGLLFVLGGQKAVGIVGDEVGQIGVDVHLEIKDPAVVRERGELGRDRVSQDGEAGELLPVRPSHFDLGHHPPRFGVVEV